MEILGRQPFSWARPLEQPEVVEGSTLRFAQKRHGQPYSRYEPMKQTGLWLQFAQVSVAPDQVASILSFAESFGPLGVRSSAFVSEVDEPLANWRGEAQHIARASEIWAASFPGLDMTRLVPLLENHPKTCQYNWRDPAAWREVDEDLERGATLGASWAVTQDVNDAFLRCGVSVGLALDEPGRRLHLDILPSNLIGCIWLQFARAVDGNKVYSKCDNCGSYFEIGSNTTARSDKRFCTPSCKANAHRKLKDEIRRLYREGMTVSTIAKQTGKDILKIKEWVKS